MSPPTSTTFDDLAARAYLVRDAVVASKRMSEGDRMVAVAALAEIVSAARRAAEYEDALRLIAGEGAQTGLGVEPTVSGIGAFARKVLRSTAGHWASNSSAAANG